MQERHNDASDQPSGRIDRPSGPSSVTEWLKWGVRLDPDAPAVQDGDRCLTHREFDPFSMGPVQARVFLMAITELRAHYLAKQHAPARKRSK